MTSLGKFTFVDHSGEKSTASYHFLDADAVTYDAVLAGWNQLLQAILALTYGNEVSSSLHVARTEYLSGFPTNPQAQREIKALVTYRDNGGNLFQMTIPVFGYDGVQVGTDVIDLTHPNWAAFVNTFESNAVSPNDLPVSVESAVLIGANI